MPKAQSAMEYLITYSWALIVIAVVLGTLYSLGFFDTNTFGSRTTPGACQVARPYGPGTIQQVNLQGVCSDGWPRSVAIFSGNGRITMPNLQLYNSIYVTNGLTISAWVYTNSSVNQDMISKTSSYTLGTSGSTGIVLNTYLGSITANAPSLQNTWHYIVATYNGRTMSLYVDGALSNSTSQSGEIANSSNNITIGSGPDGGFTGKISNVQIYNTSLSSNQIYNLYINGIGSPPTFLQNLLGWWPLNSDVNDYSGNIGNGLANTIIFSSTWTKGYNH
jgi:hypothetical protein